MKNDTKPFFPAEVDVSRARASSASIGIEFSNEIDVWSQMEFRARHQMRHLRQFGTMKAPENFQELNSFFYWTRQAMDSDEDV
jgi:hypothetical protein